MACFYLTGQQPDNITAVFGAAAMACGLECRRQPKCLVKPGIQAVSKPDSDSASKRSGQRDLNPSGQPGVVNLPEKLAVNAVTSFRHTRTQEPESRMSLFAQTSSLRGLQEQT